MPGMNAEQRKLVPLPAMCRRLGVTQRWLRAEAEAGRLPALRAGARLLFLPEAVEEALVQRATEVLSKRGGTDGK